MRYKVLSYDEVENYVSENEPTDEEISAVIDSPAVENLLKTNLSEKQREYVLLYYKKGLTMRKIAEKCGVNVSTVSRTINRARKRVFGGMEKECFRRLLGGR